MTARIEEGAPLTVGEFTVKYFRPDRAVVSALAPGSSPGSVRCAAWVMPWFSALAALLPDDPERVQRHFEGLEAIRGQPERRQDGAVAYFRDGQLVDVCRSWTSTDPDPGDPTLAYVQRIRCQGNDRLPAPDLTGREAYALVSRRPGKAA